MCGICGYYLMREANHRVDDAVLSDMTDSLIHRGPDSYGYHRETTIQLGFRRLSIVGVENGDQPIYNEDRSIVVICNGEIFNYIELRETLAAQGHRFYTKSDVEVLVHLYEEYGTSLLQKLNGQFAFALYDVKQHKLFLARDHFGICPLYYTVSNGIFIFASEIKAILRYPHIVRQVDLVGLDQILTFPGLISPRTMFRGINSLESGHYLVVDEEAVRNIEYWDLEYPYLSNPPSKRPEEYYVEGLREHLRQSIRYRLRSDVTVGFYLSGGLDSSLIAAMAHSINQNAGTPSFSITFPGSNIDESRYQEIAIKAIKGQNSLQHTAIAFHDPQITDNLRQVIYHCECPLRETYNTASILLSRAVKESGISVILTGEGADELFAGYVGYRFDMFADRRNSNYFDIESMLESDLRARLWGDSDFFYEKDYLEFTDTRKALYSDRVNEQFNEINCYDHFIINKNNLINRNKIHQRSYVDFKLRISDHLLTDHGDKMALANAVEARYPFLDIELVNFARSIPENLLVKDYVEKYVLKQVALSYLPKSIVNREKFAFLVQGSPCMLKQDVDWLHDLISYERIKREGYFNPETVEKLKKQYLREGFKLNLPFESDLLITVITFGIFREIFELPCL